MADQSDAAVELCKSFYSKFDKGDLNGVVDLFAHDAVIEIGAGGSAHAVAYHGVFRGRDAIRAYYQQRLERSGTPIAPVRPFCNFAPQPCVHWPWVIFSGRIGDRARDGAALYDGQFLHVWTVDAEAKSFTALCMHFESGQPGTAKPAP